MAPRFYITTAIDYVNSLPHIGTAYEKIGADVLARYHRMLGDEVRLQMGNDEHSTNVIKAAAAQNLDPKTYCDSMRKEFEKAWEKLEVSYDGFIQTSEENHKKGVAKLFDTIEKNGDIYKARYEGWYCESCEAYFTEKDLVDGLCPNHKSKPTWMSQENYFFRLSKYRDALVKHIKDNPSFIVPESRRNEILSFLNEGLEDISVSRSGVGWGVPLPNDPSHVVYVWFDALINYITAVGYGWDDKMFAKHWPAQAHIIGKDIIRFHCIIWPAMLMSAGITLPKTILVHGFITSGGEKMSKTLGNVVRPMEVVDKHGADPLRYFLLRQGPFSNDIDFTWDSFISRYNGDLANGLGNLVSRTVGMATKYLGGKIKKWENDAPASFSTALGSMAGGIANALDFTTTGHVEFNVALASIWEAISVADRYISDMKPWELAKQNDLDKINDILAHVASLLRFICIYLSPFIPTTAMRMWKSMGYAGKLENQKANIAKTWTCFENELSVNLGENLFPRIEVEKQTAPQTPKKEKKMETQTPSAAPQKPAGTIDIIDISDFAKVDLRVAEIKEASRVEGADKLLKIIVNLGTEDRQIVAGIAQHYAPEELVGKKIVVVANLKPAKLKGVESQGMLLAASDANTISILTPFRDVAIGSKVK